MATTIWREVLIVLKLFGIFLDSRLWLGNFSADGIITHMYEKRSYGTLLPSYAYRYVGR